MTMLAGHSGAQRFESHFSVCYRIAGVTTETDLGFGDTDLASDRFFEVAWFQVFVSRSEIEAWNRRIVTYRAFVSMALALQDPRLRASAKIPVNRDGDCAGTVAHGVGAVLSVGLYIVSVWAFTNGEFWIVPEHRICARNCQSPSHRRLRLGLRPGTVARHTGGLCVALRGCQR